MATRPRTAPPGRATSRGYRGTPRPTTKTDHGARLVASWRPDGTGLCCVFEDSILQVSNILPFRHVQRLTT